MSLKTYQVEERSTTSVPMKDILSPDGVPHIFAEVKSHGYFDIDYRIDKLVFVAGKYIGLIPINEYLAINVVPKVQIGNLVHVISKSREYLDSLDFFERYYSQAAQSSPTIFQFFAQCLSIELRKLEREGILKSYLRRTEDLPAPKGRINIGKTAAAEYSRGKYYRVHCDYFEFTSDNHYNRLIKFALWYCLNHLVQTGCTDKDLIRSLDYFNAFFDAIPLDKKKLFMEPVIIALHDQKLPTLRYYYENICKICRCIIEDIGIMLSEPGEDVKMLSFIIDMENVFEKYLLYVLRESISSLGQNATVLDGNKEGRGYLFSDTKKYEAKPDILVRYLDVFKLVIDVKYKNKSVESDRYQIISHALSYGVNRAILVLPVSTTNPTSGLHRIGEIGTGNKIELFEYYMNLENPDLSKEEQLYVQAVKELANT